MLWVSRIVRIKPSSNANLDISFGAVLEEFEVRDAIESVFTERSMASIDMHYGVQPLSITA